MKQRKNGLLIRRLLCWLMALHILNISIGTPDHLYPPTQKSGFRGDYSVHRIDSFGELLLKKWLDLENLFPEKETAGEESNLTALEEDYFFPQPFHFKLTPVAWRSEDRPPTRWSIRVLSHIREIPIPPPQV
ncbi:hypothetical protein [Larkinella soli]|uniref:hypothetical protein n=1 Tax=Larkinella soli TaxID=1770527 RepID=UPI000FFC891B|nr:hypothetical protein [Larkinella soli]